MMDYNAAYEMVMDLQQQLRTEVLADAANEQQYAEHLRHLDYRTVKALAATYELQEFLADRVEDEIFADLMLDMAAEQGAQALAENERLKNDPDFTVPEHVYQKGMEILGG